MRRMGNGGTGLALATAIALIVPLGAAAQQPKKSRTGETIIIHGQVPTPQVVTVRPRAVPEYSRQVLGPELYEQSHAAMLDSGYDVVPLRQVTGQRLVDTTMAPLAAADSAALAAQREAIQHAQTRLDSLQRAAGASAAARSAAGDSAAARVNAADAARTQEIQELLRELRMHRERLDSLSAAVENIGRPDTSRTPRDSTRKPR